VFLNLKASLDKAVVLNLIPKNPCDGVELPKRKKYSPTVYSMEQVEALLDEVKGTDMELPLHIAIALGLRRGELLALRWENVDLDTGIANICENMVRASGGVIVKEPKTSSGIRKIAIPDYLVEMLKSERRLRESQYGEAILPTLPIVCKEDGTPYKPDSFSRKFARLLERNNLEHIRLHDLRHINATILLRQGVSAKVVQGRLGHSDVSTTLNIYSHVLEEVDREAAEKLDEVLKK
jgi:integrase